MAPLTEVTTCAKWKGFIMFCPAKDLTLSNTCFPYYSLFKHNYEKIKRFLLILFLSGSFFFPIWWRGKMRKETFFIFFKKKWKDGWWRIVYGKEKCVCVQKKRFLFSLCNVLLSKQAEEWTLSQDLLEFSTFFLGRCRNSKDASPIPSICPSSSSCHFPETATGKKWWRNFPKKAPSQETGGGGKL